MTYQAFTGSAAARQRYWARSHLGWRHITGAGPNSGHRAVARLERAGLVRSVITQNVDGLHQAAGASAVTELHGSLHRVVCLGCWRRSAREELDARLRAANPGWAGATSAGEPAVNPDGDVALRKLPGSPWWTASRAAGCSSRTSCSSGRTCRSRAPPPASTSSPRPRAGGARVVADGAVGLRYVRHAVAPDTGGDLNRGRRAGTRWRP